MKFNVMRISAQKKNKRIRPLILMLAFALTLLFFNLDSNQDGKKNNRNNINNRIERKMSTTTHCSVSPGPHEMKQPDGTKLTYKTFGDELSVTKKTVDGYTLLGNKNEGYYYAELDYNNDMVNSGVRASNPDQRNRRELRFLDTIRKNLNFSKEQISNRNQDLYGTKRLWTTARVEGTFPTTGNNRLLVILVNFQDVRYTYNRANVDNLMNGNFSRYYRDVSYNNLNITADVVGPYLLSQNRAVYGAQTNDSSDADHRRLGQEAIDLAQANGVNFSTYDNDGNGEADGVMVICAGYGQEWDGDTHPDALWARRSNLSWNGMERNYDGVTIDYVMYLSELAYAAGGNLQNIGVIVHEFGHNLGLPDLYDTNGNTDGSSIGCGRWDVMAGGNWLNTGITPSQHSAYNKWKMEWLVPTELTTRRAVLLRNLNDEGDAFYFESEVDGELFMVENRQQTGWDEHLPGHGLLIYHVDENDINDGAFNLINATPNHQGYDIEEADGIHDGATYDGDPFPGEEERIGFTDISDPNSLAWDNTITAKPITNITENIVNGNANDPRTITFLFMEPLYTLIEAGSVWNYYDQDNSPGANWTSPAFNDDNWSSGNARLGYNDNAVTVIDPGTAGSPKYMTAYFRRDFNYAEDGNVHTLYIRLIRDDGAVVYINGYEVGRSNMPDGAVNHNTAASSGVSGDDETKFYSIELSSDLQVNGNDVFEDGNNVIAVEIHQNTSGSSDLGFDLSLHIYGGEDPAAATPPVADFSGTPTQVNEGQSVNFTDLSTNNSTSWAWVFPGGTPASSNLENPTVTYNTAGTYNVTLTATNVDGSDTEIKNSYITVNQPTQQYTLTANTVGQGNIAMNPAGGTYNSGTNVTVTATPEAGWQFDSWSGSATGAGTPAILMDSDKTITATFTEIPANTPMTNKLALKGASGGTKAKGVVTVLSGGVAVPGAVVNITWSGSHTGPAQLTTNSKGKTKFLTPTLTKPWTCTFTVNSITKNGYTWDQASSVLTKTKTIN